MARLAELARREAVLRAASLIALLCVELAVFGALSPNFLSQSNLFTVATLDTENGIIALGMAIVIASGGIDLSVGATLALSSVVLGYAVAHGAPLAVAVVACLAGALVCGLVNGLLVVLLRLHPLLVTLGTLALYRGLALGISNGNGFSDFPTSFEYFGQTYIGTVPAQCVAWLVLAILVYLVVRVTPAGRRLLAVGVNEVATTFAGIRVGAVRLAVYGASGLLAGIASLIYSSRVFSVRGDSGGGLELLAIAAVVVGGASIRGGEISVLRTTLAVVVIGVIPNGLVLAGVDTSLQYVTIGVVMVVAIAVNELFLRRLPAAAGAAAR
jgi:rhamnose transport system permease protein